MHAGYVLDRSGFMPGADPSRPQVESMGSPRGNLQVWPTATAAFGPELRVSCKCC